MKFSAAHFTVSIQRRARRPVPDRARQTAPPFAGFTDLVRRSSLRRSASGCTATRTPSACSSRGRLPVTGWWPTTSTSSSGCASFAGRPRAAPLTCLQPQSSRRMHPCLYVVSRVRWHPLRRAPATDGALPRRSRWDETYLVPGESPFVQIEQGGGRVRITHNGVTQDLPAGDCCIIPVRNVTVEELSHLLLQARSPFPRAPLSSPIFPYLLLSSLVCCSQQFCALQPTVGGRAAYGAADGAQLIVGEDGGWCAQHGIVRVQAAPAPPSTPSKAGGSVHGLCAPVNCEKNGSKG